MLLRGGNATYRARPGSSCGSQDSLDRKRRGPMQGRAIEGKAFHKERKCRPPKRRFRAICCRDRRRRARIQIRPVTQYRARQAMIGNAAVIRQGGAVGSAVPRVVQPDNRIHTLRQMLLQRRILPRYVRRRTLKAGCYAGVTSMRKTVTIAIRRAIPWSPPTGLAAPSSENSGQRVSRLKGLD
jgi:hypothetical protein